VLLLNIRLEFIDFYSLDISINVVKRLLSDQPVCRVAFPRRGRGICLLHSVETGLGFPPISCSASTGILSPNAMGQSRELSLAVPMIRINGAILHSPIHSSTHVNLTSWKNNFVYSYSYVFANFPVWVFEFWPQMQSHNFENILLNGNSSRALSKISVKFSSPRNIRIIKSRRLWWAGRVARLGCKGMHIDYWWER
jgi:hypothetical protein